MPISDYLKRLRTKVGHDLLIMPSVTVVVYDDRGRVLLVKHADTGHWVAPGGSIDPDESPSDAAVREMWEETGLLVKPVRIIGVYGGPEFEVIYQNGDRITYVMTVFEGQVLKGELRADGVETLKLAYYSKAEILSLNIPLWLRAILPDIFNARDGACFQQAQWKPAHHK